MDAAYLYLNSHNELFRINLMDVVFFEASGNYTEINLVNGAKSVVCMNLAKIPQNAFTMSAGVSTLILPFAPAPLSIQILSSSSLVKCKPAVGAAAEPTSRE